MILPEGKKIILFDGICNYCNGIINKIIENDKENIFVFAAIQSEKGQQIIKHIGLDSSIDSIVLYDPGFAYYVKADAVLQIINHLNGKYTLLKLGHLLPESIRNIAYDYFAKNRYKWYGKTEECRVPTELEREKFLN